MGVDDEDVILDIKLLDELCEKKAQVQADALAVEAGFAGGAVMVWNGHYDMTPKLREGFVNNYGASRLDPEVKAQSIAHFKLLEDGSGLEIHKDYCFIPATQAARRAAETQKPETAAEREARLRKAAIERRAIHLAAPKVAGTPLEGRAYWPGGGYIPSVEQDDDGTFVVALLIKIPAADVEAVFAEAEQLYDQELIERAQLVEAARIAAAAQTDAGEPAELEETV
jgi:ParB family chromosome partitioning protein